MNSDPDRPLRGDTGRRLAKVVGVDVERLHAPIDAINLVDRPCVRDDWPATEAREVATALLDGARDEGRRVVLLGRRVAAAFGLVGPAPFSWLDVDGVQVAYSPHPSGKSRWWNDEDNKRRARKWWRALHAEEAGRQGVGESQANPPGKRRGGPIHGDQVGGERRTDVELSWIRDRLEDAYVASGSASIAARAVERQHAELVASGHEVAHGGFRFLPTHPLSRNHAHNLIRDVLEHWRHHDVEHREDRRRLHHEMIAARIASAVHDREWSAVAALHKILAVVDGVIERDRGAPPTQIAVTGQVVGVSVAQQTERLSHLEPAELDQLEGILRRLPGTSTGG